MPVFRVVLALAIARSCFAGIVSFEGDSFPENVGWERRDTVFTAQRSLSDGWFVQDAHVIQIEPPQFGEEDYYARSITEFAGTPAFFVEWRMDTDGSRAGIPAVAPAVLVASGSLGVFYHFTIAEDQARLIDPDLSVLLIGVALGVPHTYRLELYGTESFRWLIDGQVVDSGVPGAAYPDETSRIVFGAAAVGEGNTTRWDYIRYGTIPEPATGALLLFGWMVMIRPRRRHRSPRPC